jgi:glutamyl-tRNA reductase
MKKLLTVIIAFILLFWALNNIIGAQEGQSQTMKLLTLKKAQLQLEKTKGDFERSLKLKEQGLTSEEDFARVDAMTRSMINKLLHNPIITLKQAATAGVDRQAVENMVRALMGIGA